MGREDYIKEKRTKAYKLTKGMWRIHGRRWLIDRVTNGGVELCLFRGRSDSTTCLDFRSGHVIVADTFRWQFPLIPVLGRRGDGNEVCFFNIQNVP